MKLIVFRCQNLFFLHWKKNILRDERDELRDNQRKRRYTVEFMMCTAAILGRAMTRTH